jgi:hypothetical protein
VVGTLRTRGDGFGSADGIAEDALRRYPQDPVPVFFEKIGSLDIARRTIPHIMGLAVDLDSEARSRTIKVDHIGADRVLAAKLKTCRAQPELLPQHSFRQAHFAP